MTGKSRDQTKPKTLQWKRTGINRWKAGKYAIHRDTYRDGTISLSLFVEWKMCACLDQASNRRGNGTLRTMLAKEMKRAQQDLNKKFKPPVGRNPKVQRIKKARLQSKAQA